MQHLTKPSLQKHIEQRGVIVLSPEMLSFAFTISAVSRPSLYVSVSIVWILSQAPENSEK